MTLPDRRRPPSGHRGPGLPWTVVLPLKGGSQAKSRLGAGPELAGAIARDCLAAVLACPAVRECLVVTGDPVTAGYSAADGATVVAEPPSGGLLAAVGAGLTAAAGVPGPVAVLLGDLPALRPEDLATALAAMAGALAGPPPAVMAAVPDAEGTGTVLLAAASASRLDPAFGPDSRAEHARRGAALLELALPRLRRDVDTPADLRRAVALGVGGYTRAALSGRGRTLGACKPLCTASSPSPDPASW